MEYDEYDDCISHFQFEDGSYGYYDELTGSTGSYELSDLKKDHDVYGKIIDELCLEILDMVPENKKEAAEKNLNAINRLTKKRYWLEILIPEEYPESNHQEVAENFNYFDAEDVNNFKDIKQVSDLSDDELLRALVNM